MATVLLDQGIEIPQIENLAEFRRWALSEDFPDRGRIDYIAGRVEVDFAQLELFTHSTLLAALIAAINRQVVALDLGHALARGTRVSSACGDVSAEPDVIVIAYDALDAGRVRLVPNPSGEPDRFVEVEGGPDLIVEVVSDSSVKKDTKRLPPAYFAAGVREFWLIDARGKELIFQIHRRGVSGFEAVSNDGEGHQRSEVLDAAYLLERSRHQRGHWNYRLRQR